jgi:hypothetical protein
MEYLFSRRYSIGTSCIKPCLETDRVSVCVCVES